MKFANTSRYVVQRLFKNHFGWHMVYGYYTRPTICANHLSKEIMTLKICTVVTHLLNTVKPEQVNEHRRRTLKRRPTSSSQPASRSLTPWYIYLQSSLINALLSHGQPIYLAYLTWWNAKDVRSVEWTWIAVDVSISTHSRVLVSEQIACQWYFWGLYYWHHKTVIKRRFHSFIRTQIMCFRGHNYFMHCSI